MKESGDVRTGREEEDTLPIDRGWAWIVLIASTTICLLHVGTIKCFSLFLIEFLEVFKEGVTQTVVIFSLINATYAILSIPVLSVGLRHFSGRQIGFVGCFLCTIGFIISSFAQSLAFLIFSIGIVVGCGGALVFSPIFITLGHFFDKRRGLANGVCASGSCIGGLTFPPLIRFLLDTYGLRGALILIGGIYSHVFACLCLMRPMNFYRNKLNAKKTKQSLLSNGQKETDVDENCKNHNLGTVIKDCKINNKEDIDKLHIKRQPGFLSLLDMSKVSASEFSLDRPRIRTFSDCQSYPEQHHVTSNGVKRYLSNQSIMTVTSFADADWKTIEPETPEENGEHILLSLLKDKPFVLFVLYNSIASIAGGLSYTFTPLYAKDFGLSNEEIVIILIILGVCDFVGRIVCGFVADLPRVKTPFIFMVSQLIVAVVANCARLVQSFGTFCLFSIGYGLFCGVMFSLGPGLLSRIVGLEKFPVAFSIAILCQQMAIGGSGPLLGYLRDSTGDYYASFHYMGGAAFLVVILIVIQPLTECVTGKKWE